MNAEQALSADARDLKPGTVASALESCGCFVIRNAVPSEALTRITERVEQGYADLETAHQQGTLSESAKRRNYGYGILRPFEDDLICSDGRPLRDNIQDIVRTGLLKDVMRAYLGPEVTLLLEACHVRKQGPGQVGRPVPLHQDASVMRMPAGRLLNFWVPLVDGAGSEAPGLEFYPKSLDTIVQCERKPAGDGIKQRMYSNFEIDETSVQAAVGETQLWSPVLNRGDVLCLDGWSIHRTAFKPTMQRTRFDFEMRFCRTKDLVPEMPGETQSVKLDEWAA